MSGDPNNTRIFDITTGDAIVDGMSARVAWGPTTITYAFPDAGADYDPTNYNILSPYDEPNNFAAFNAAQKAVSLAALSNIAGFTNVGFTLGSDATANIRMANSGAGGDNAGLDVSRLPQRNNRRRRLDQQHPSRVLDPTGRQCCTPGPDA